MRILFAVTTALLLVPYGSAMPRKSDMMDDLSNLRGLQTNTTIPESNTTNTTIAEPNTTNTTIAESKAANEGVVGDACCEGEKPTSLTFQYTGDSCGDVANHPQNVGNKNKFDCKGAVGSAPVALGDIPNSLTVTPINDININALQVGNEFIISGKFGSKLEITVGKQYLVIHTSCSAPFPLGIGYGALELIAYAPQSPECTPPPPPFCTNDVTGGPLKIDAGCVKGFPACIAAPGEDGNKCCVCQNTDASDRDEGCGNPGLCFDGDKEPCFLEGGTKCVCIDDAEDGDRDAGCTRLSPFCGQQIRGSRGLGREAQFPSIDGNIGNRCFECYKDINGTVFGCESEERCVGDERKEVQPGQLGTCVDLCAGISCDDGKPCTADSCDANTGNCSNDPIPGCCSEPSPKDTGSCTAGTTCQSGSLNAGKPLCSCAADCEGVEAYCVETTDNVPEGTGLCLKNFPPGGMICDENTACPDSNTVCVNSCSGFSCVDRNLICD